MLSNFIQKNIHLVISSFVVLGAAFMYGISPTSILPQFFDFQVKTPDLCNIFRATMGLYLAFALFWVVGILKPYYWKVATVSQILFMSGLAAGRALSLGLDGIPSALFVFGTAGEIILAVFGWYQLKKQRQ